MMSFPHQNTFNAIRDALWTPTTGGASVLVGSGFSRNANKARPDATEMPTWSDLASSMYEALYPPKDADRRHSIEDTAFEPSSILRLAQEYEASFGEDGLHNLIRNCVLDDYFSPGDKHHRLLRLPWRDIFTTNWDTLLERARPSIVETGYGVVRDIADIPNSTRPRIVKLHGCLSRASRLIVTEEDYRTYQANYAPFVNTVQQSMMETVVLLLGFSGDDPNFLHWSGWVRDNLRKAAPKIYLAGWFDFPQSRLRMLESRNVMVIDLARHPKSEEWPDTLKHKYAIEWLLKSLEYGRPYNICDWPASPRKEAEEPSPQLEPIQCVVSEVPKTEDTPEREPGGTLKEGATKIGEVLDVWEHNRKLYPGWLIIPSGKQQRMSLYTDEWVPHLLRALPDMELLDQLSAIFECVWRKSLLMEPPGLDLDKVASSVLKMIDCQGRTVKDSKKVKEDWGKIRKEWVSVAMTLATDARHELDRDEFDWWMGEISLFVDDDADVKHFICYENCLWTAAQLDYEQLHMRLADWRPKGADPVWTMRKAALLFEAGLPEDAERHVREALASIRENTVDPRSLANPSREGWALWSALQQEEVFERSAGTFRRWEELSIVKCNAFIEKLNYVQAITRRSDSRDSPPFDLGVVRSPGITFSNVEYYRYLSARRGVRLTELAGLPASQNGIAVASDILEHAAEELVQHEPELAVRLILRVSRYDQDKRLNRILTRSLIASTPQEVIKGLSQNTLNVIRFALPRIAVAGQRGDVIFWIEKCRVAMEALSRFVLRLEATAVEPIFSEALGWYGNVSIAKDPWFIEPVRHILARCCEALPRSRMTDCFFDLMSAPVAGMNGFHAFNTLYPEPAYLLPQNTVLPARSVETEAMWRDLVSLIVRGLRLGGEARKRVTLRLWRIAPGNVLTEAEEREVAGALWQDSISDPDDLPSDTDLLDWPFLLLPEPSTGLAERTFRHKWLECLSSMKNESETSEAFSADDMNNTLWQIGMALQGLRRNGRALTLSDTDRNGIASLIRRWSDTSLPTKLRMLHGRGIPATEEILSLEQAIMGLKYVIVEIDDCSSIGESLFRKAQELQNHGVHTRSLAAGLAKMGANRFKEIVQWMRTGVASDEERIASDAIKGLSFWLQASSEQENDIRRPSVDLVREIGVIVATRRQPALAAALECGKAVLSYGTEEQKREVKELLFEGLIYLEKALSYERRMDAHDRAGDAEMDIPLLRWGCVELAHAMKRDGLENEPVIDNWIERAASDPMPEVRYVLESMAISPGSER